MILYFSGTGNSEYAAKRIGKEIHDEAVSLFEKIRSHDFSEMSSDNPWVVVVPNYARRIPRIVQEWLMNTRLIGNKKIYFVITCGGSAGNPGKYLKKLCTAKSLSYMGYTAITMPKNYIAMLTTPTREEALEIIRQSEPVIGKAALAIRSGEPLPEPTVTFTDKMSSGIANDLFYILFVHAEKFCAADTCISCGKCVRVWPLNNIRLENGKPVWGKNCTHCMACICRCPSKAIEYGEHSRGLERYVCPEYIKE